MRSNFQEEPVEATSGGLTPGYISLWRKYVRPDSEYARENPSFLFTEVFIENWLNYAGF